MWDLEQLQLLDYASLDRVTTAQRDFIATRSKEAPIHPEEMAYLALRSLYCFSWPLPETKAAIERAAAFEYALARVLTSVALDIAKHLAQPDARLPYWGRLSFLRVMCKLPGQQIVRAGLDKVALTLIKRKSFNATSFSLSNGSVVGLNFALEPILKSLNRYFLHFHHSQAMAGPKRIWRGWREIAPIVMYFWADAAANKIAVNLPLFDAEAAQEAQWLTVSQLDFIVTHEFGHIAHNHPARLLKTGTTATHALALRHAFEFEADAFAYHVMKHNRLGTSDVPDKSQDRDAIEPGWRPPTEFEYSRDREAVQLLFVYMAFIDKAGQLLRSRLGSKFKFRRMIDTHPSASDRGSQIERVYPDAKTKTERVDYAESFFSSLLSYAESVDESEHLAAATRGEVR